MHRFTAIYLHIVWATWNRKPFLTQQFRARTHAYLAATGRNLGLNEVIVGGVDDHVHLLARFEPSVPISSVIGQMKQSATTFLQEEIRSFRWQRGFAAFSVSRDRLLRVRRYIERQEEHHKTATMEEELAAMLLEFGVTETGLL